MAAIVVEVNASHSDGSPVLRDGAGISLVLTPPISEEYWLWRVKVAKDQAIVCFRKFGTIGCGFQREADWNTNLPIACPADEIYEHIKHNKKCRAAKATCIAAIEALQKLAATTIPDWDARVARHARSR